jgi:Fur family transcriptional regulator, iron response regulator
VKRDTAELLREHGIQPSSQRVAIADFVLGTDEHPSADRVFAEVKERLPVVSRATVYNTLNLLCEKGLLRQLVLAEGRVVFDPHTGPHHHFIDEVTGAIHDVPWDAVRVSRIEGLEGFDVREYQVVMRGRRRPSRRR